MRRDKKLEENKGFFVVAFLQSGRLFSLFVKCRGLSAREASARGTVLQVSGRWAFESLGVSVLCCRREA